MASLAAKHFNFETALDKCSMKKNKVGAQVRLICVRTAKYSSQVLEVKKK